MTLKLFFKVQFLHSVPLRTVKFYTRLQANHLLDSAAKLKETVLHTVPLQHFYLTFFKKTKISFNYKM